MLALILAPRHPGRGDALAETLRGKGCNVAQRSKGRRSPPTPTSISPTPSGRWGSGTGSPRSSFVGGSLVDVGGHNPFEPALLGSAIIHGPHVRNFIDGYRRLAQADAAVLARSEAELAEAIVATMAPDGPRSWPPHAWEAVSEGAEVTDAVLAAIGDALDARD